MKIKEITGALERFAPLPLQDGYDNAGLQVGLTEAEATGALLCIDVTEAVVDEAIACGCNLIVAHHPLLFKGCKSITGKNYVERCIYKAIRHDIAIYAAHTNLDNAQGGVSHKMAEKLGLTNVRILDEKKDMLLKMATYVPEEKADEVRQALWQAGCGCIGNYDCCSYNLEGTGTFRAQPGTHPYCGSIGQVHSQREVRVETVLPRYRQPQALAAIARTHPYEEPAIDVHALQNTWAQAGCGIVGELDRPMPLDDFLRKVKETFAVGCLRHNAPALKEVRRVALCGGAGAFLLPLAMQQGADAFVTGEIKYHDFFGYDNMLLAETGHYESEQYTTEIFAQIIRQACPELTIRKTEINTNPIKYL